MNIRNLLNIENLKFLPWGVEFNKDIVVFLQSLSQSVITEDKDALLNWHVEGKQENRSDEAQQQVEKSHDYTWFGSEMEQSAQKMLTRGSAARFFQLSQKLDEVPSDPDFSHSSLAIISGFIKIHE